MSVVFGVLGGDLRQVYLARSMAADGYPVFLSGLELAPPEKLGDELCTLSLTELCGKCSVLLLPLPATRDGQTLNAPYAKEPIALDDGFADLCAGHAVYGGMLGKLFSTSPLWEKIDARDYYEREELIMGNAFLTAEGAIGAAIQEFDGALCGSHCLVTGFGRIGKALCGMLKGMGARVDCCARKPKDLAAIRMMGVTPLEYRQLGGGYDVIFNTVPALVLTAHLLARQAPGTLLLELASAPGGIDLEAACRLPLKVKELPGLPGKLSPRASGELIKETIYNMLEEG